MCGRYSLAKPKRIKAKDLKIKSEEVDRLRPRFNIAPSQNVAAILNQEPRSLESLKWGLIPSWAKDPSIGQRMINARAETLAQKPSFKGLLRKHRCLILADGFYEWAETPRGKQPYRIRLKNDDAFTFAGLWSHWKDPKGQEIRTCAIITCVPNGLVERIHNRMPVLLDAEARDIWLDPGNEDETILTALLKPYPEEEMQVYPVSKIVNSPENDREECLAGVG